MKTILTSILIALISGAASAATINLNVTAATHNQTANDFYGQLETLYGAGNVGFGLVHSVDVLVAGAHTFESVGGESGYKNQFTAIDETIWENNDGNISTVEETAVANLPLGMLPNGEMSFKGFNQAMDTNIGVDAYIGDIGFGVFFSKNGLDFASNPISYVFLAYDDGGAGPDGDYDDIFVRTEATVSVVPLPASALLLLGGLGGFSILRRKRT